MAARKEVNCEMGGESLEVKIRRQFSRIGS